MRFLILFLFFIMTSLAHAVGSLSYSGRLVNANGSPVSGKVNLSFDLAYSNNQNVILCTQTLNNIELTHGVFHVTLNFPSCDLTDVMSNIPDSNTIIIRVVDITNGENKKYPFQSIHSIPFSFVSQMSKQLVQMDASDGQVLAWNGDQWAPKTLDAAIPDGSVTDEMLQGNIPRSKFEAGMANQIIVNDASGKLSSMDANTARVFLGAMAVTDVPMCLLNQKLQMSGGIWVCEDDLTIDATKLPLTGGTLTGDLFLSKDPTAPLEAATKKYVDTAISAIDLTSVEDDLQSVINRGAITTTFTEFNGGSSFSKIGIGTNVPVGVLDIQSTTSGILIPRMDGSQRDAIATPNGMQIYNTTTNKINFHDGTSWKALGVAGSGVQSVTAGTGLVATTIDDTGTLNVDVGTLAGQIPRLNGSGKLESSVETDPTVQAFAKAVLPTCGVGEILKSNGTSFSCVTDVDTFLVADGISLVSTGSTISVKAEGILDTNLKGISSSCSADQILLTDGLGAFNCGNRHWGEFVGGIFYNSGSIAIGGPGADSNAILDLQSTTKGFLPPRMSTAQRNGIFSPSSGLVVFDTDENSLYVYSNSSWIKLGGPQFAFRVHRGGTDQAIAMSGDYSKVNFYVEDYDTDNAFDLTSDRFSPNKAGYYWVHGSARWLSLPADKRGYFKIDKNGSSLVVESVTSRGGNNNISSQLSTLVYLNGTTDYVQLMAQQPDNAGSVNIDGGSIVTYFTGFAINSGSLSGGGGADHLGNHVATQNLSLGGNWLSGDGEAEGLFIDASGNVGVGKSNPEAKLDIGGSFRLSGATSGFVGFAPADEAGSTIWTLPVADGASGEILQTDGAGKLSWASNAPADSSIEYSKLNLNDGVIPQTKVSGLTTDLLNKEPKIDSGTSLQYIRGDKTLGTLSTSVVPEGTNKYFTEDKVLGTFLNIPLTGNPEPIIINDTLLGGLGKLQAQISDSGKWSKNSTSIYYSSGNVGIGTDEPASPLTVTGMIESSSGGFKFPDGTVLTSANGGGTAGSAVAWVSFNSVGTILSSFNISSVTRSSVGRFTINFAQTLSDSNYAVVTGGVNTGLGDGGWASVDTSGAGKTTSSVKLYTYSGSGSVMDYPETYVVIYQGNGTAPIANGQWTQAGNDVYRTSGKVGIGTSTPVQKLDVNGTIRIQGDLNFQNTSSDTGDIVFLEHDGNQKGRIWADTAPGSEFLYFSTGDTSVDLTIDPTGNIGIGTSLPSSKLHVNGNAAVTGDLIMAGNDSYIWTNGTGTGLTGIYDQANNRVLLFASESSGNVGIGTSTPSYKLHVNGSVAGSSWSVSSDLRFKKDIQSLDNSLARLLQLNGVNYNWRQEEFPERNFEGSRDLGLIAQNVEKVFPEAVTEDKEGYKGVKYGNLIAPVVEAIKELFYSKANKTEVEALRKENAEMKAYLCGKDPEAPMCK